MAADQLVAEKHKEKQRIELKIQKFDAIDNYMKQQKADYDMTGQESLRRILHFP